MDNFFFFSDTFQKAYEHNPFILSRKRFCIDFFKDSRYILLKAIEEIDVIQMAAPGIIVDSFKEIMPKGYLLNLELMPYPLAWDLQHRIVERKVKGPFPDVLILLEHLPVITLGRRGRVGNIRVSEQILERHSVSIHRVERGGDVTYHGPGQLVGYPLIALQPMGIGVVDFVSRLEDLMIRILANCGVQGHRDSSCRGVWVGGEKIGSVGVAVRRWITYHGFALNYNPIAEHMDYVVPCGLTGVRMTSIRSQTGASPDPAYLRSCASHHFSRIFGMELIPLSLREMEEELMDG